MADNQPNLDGGSGDTMMLGGGGVPGTGTGSSSIPSGFPVAENGGVFGTTWFLMVPSQDIRSGLCYLGFYDITSFDDRVDGSSYSYRREDLAVGRTPTVHTVVLQYRDIGPALVVLTITATNDLQQVITASVKQQIGNTIPTNAIHTVLVGIQLTGFGPQLSWSRDPSAGPVEIISATMAGEIEEAEL